MKKTPKDIFSMLQETGLPVAYHHFRVEGDSNTPPTPPFITWVVDDEADFFADNSNYSHIRQISVELYSDLKDFEKEAEIETLLKSNGLTYTVDYTYINSEKLYLTIFTFDINFS